MSAYTSQSSLESAYGAERVAQLFSVQATDGSTTGAVDATTIAFCIRMASAVVDRKLLGVHQADMPFTAPYDDTIIEIVNHLVMHAGWLRRPEYAGAKLDQSPYFFAAQQARKDLDEIRAGMQRISETKTPANVGGSIDSNLPATVQPFYFAGNPATGLGGFNSGGY